MTRQNAATSESQKLSTTGNGHPRPHAGSFSKKPTVSNGAIAAIPQGRRERRRQNLISITLTLGQFVCFLALGMWLGRGWKKALEPMRKHKAFDEAYRLAIHYAGSPVVLQNDSTPHLDACSILSHCFPVGMFAARPEDEDPLAHCHRNLNGLLKGYDSGFLYENGGKGQLVGFITSTLSSGVRSNRPFSAVSFYNVCVHPDARGRSISKQLLAAYAREVVEKRLPKAERPTGHRLYLGLDVDFSTPDAVAAFSIYAKAGFVRWWEPCRSIADFDFWKLERQARTYRGVDDDSQAVHRESFPMAEYWIDRKRAVKTTINDALRQPTSRLYTHFCMVKQMAFPGELEYENDDFASMGKVIEEHVHEAIAQRQAQQKHRARS